MNPEFALLRCFHTAPPPPKRDEEQLLLGQVRETRKHGIRVCLLAFLPRLEGCTQPPGIGDGLRKHEFSIDMHLFPAGHWDGELVVLVDEALCSFLEGLDGRVVPPVPVCPVLIEVSATVVERYIVSAVCGLRDGTYHAKAHAQH